jgi:hypothetical protein
VAQEAQPFPRVGERRAGVAGIEVVAEPTDSFKQINAAILADWHAALNKLREALSKRDRLRRRPVPGPFDMP